MTVSMIVMNKCMVCGVEALPLVHPCRFEVACSCWYGLACQPLEQVTPTCDICGEEWEQGGEGEDWNGDTGNHVSCESEVGA